VNRLRASAVSVAVGARGAVARGSGMARGAFTLIELLVAITIMLVLVGIVAAGASSARTSSKRQATQLLINKLDAIIQQQYATYASRGIPAAILTAPTPSGFTSKAAYRAWYIRRNLISGDMPDNWADVGALASGSSVGFGSSDSFPLTAPQRAYAGVFRSGSATPTWGDAECLFMIVMQGGIANCIDCGELRTADRGDKDGDGAFEFWDAWGNPIGFVLWPAGLQLPPGSGTRFFTSGGRALENPFPAAGTPVSPGLGMRPLIYSAGPDGVPSIAVSSANIALGRDCGDPTNTTVAKLADYLSDPANPGDYRADNITNFDAEASR
jgi:prepilin-type N-terminal cleavage/methylation domain-containing protein